VLLWSTFCILTEMLPVERVAADWERLAWPGPLYSLAPLYKHAEACPASAVTRRSNLCKHKRSSTSLTTFILNWAHFFQPIDEIYQTAITPPSPLILAPVLGASVSRVILADPGFLHVANPPKTLAKALAWGGRDVRGEVWFGSFFRRLIVLWWFLQSYMRSGLFSSWIFLRI
jgi:hypothetical protein